VICFVQSLLPHLFISGTYIDFGRLFIMAKNSVITNTRYIIALLLNSEFGDGEASSRAGPRHVFTRR
jgi:hypothetical protein